VIESLDFTWDFVPISHWNCAELNVGIICACLMTMKPLIDRAWPAPSAGNRDAETTGQPNATDWLSPTDQLSSERQKAGFKGPKQGLYMFDPESAAEKATVFEGENARRHGSAAS
jgi:hypothetical protein